MPQAGVDLEHVKPYADHLGDGIVQFSFTLPVPYGLAARKAAQELARKMGFEHPEVVHYQGLTEGYTYFVMFGECTQTVDYATLSDEGFEIEYMSEDRDRSVRARADRPPDRDRRRGDRHRHAQRRDRRDAQPEGLSRASRPGGVQGVSRRTTSAARCPTACSSRARSS